jgi:hypothetical protein
MIVGVAKRYFTPEEANEALAEVRPLAERLVEQRRALARAAARRAELAARIAGDGGGLEPSRFAEAQQQLESEAAAVARCVEELQALGVLVKDPDRGLVDFPSLRAGEEVLLCWHVGEEEVAYWHGLEEGFAGRKPIFPSGRGGFGGV